MLLSSPSPTAGTVGGRNLDVDVPARDTRYCHADKCPILGLHRRHNVNAAIDAFVWEAVTSKAVNDLPTVLDRCQDLPKVDVERALRRLVDAGKLGCVDGPQAGPFYYREGEIAQEDVDAIDVTSRSRALVVYRPPRTSTLDECVVNTVRRRLARPFWQIYRDTADTFGTVTERTVYRAIARLIKRGAVVHVGHRVGAGGYVLAGSPLLQDSETVAEQLLVAYLERAAI